MVILGHLLSFVSPSSQKEIVAAIPWGIILMISGIVTYVIVMDYIIHLVSLVDSPKLAISVTCYIDGVIPLLIPMLATGNIWVIGAVAAVCIASSIVDICAFSTTGAIFVANAQGAAKETFYNTLLNSSIALIVVGPLLAWLAYVALFKFD